MYIESKVSISQADYIELQSKDSRWTLDEYAYWVAKFKSCYPVEGYGLLKPRLEQQGNEYYIIWKHSDNCD